MDSKRFDRRQDERQGVGADWLTADDAASYLGFSTRRALYQSVRRGHVPAHRLGKRRLRFSRTELDKVLLKGR